MPTHTKVLAVMFLSLLLIALAAGADSEEGTPVTVFGPQGFQRGNGRPDVFHQTFDATEESGQLEVFNGGPNKDTQVTSAWVKLNGNQIFGPDDFKKGDPLLRAPVTLGAQDTLEIKLASSPGTYVVVRVTENLPFEERTAGVLRADLAVTNLVLTPDRCSTGTALRLQAAVTNFGPEDSDPATLVFGIDDTAIAQITVDALPAQASGTFAIDGAAGGPGRHEAWARVQPGAGTIDPSAGNNSRFALLRVSGESSPVPELEFGPPQFDPGPPAMITLTVANPSFADLSDVTLRLYLVSGPPTTLPELPQRRSVAGPPAPERQAGAVAPKEICVGWDCFPDFIPLLPAGTSTTAQFPWLYDTAGQYVVEVRAENLPESFRVEEATASWDFVFPIASAIVGGPAWSSLGPYQLDEPKTGPNTGKISTLAIDPQNPNVIYGGSANYGDVISGAGLWKTEDGGQHWTPLGDKFSQMNISAIAVDPTNSDIVYCATGAWHLDTPPPVGPGLPDPITGYIFKSVDGGKNWVSFGHPADGYRRLVLRRQAASPHVVIYAASNRGVLRYTSDDPSALSSQPTEWPVILPGKISNIVVDPSNPDLVFAVRYTGTCLLVAPPCANQLDGLYWTSTGLTAAGFQDWPNDYRFTTPADDQFMAVDLFPANPQKVYLLAGDSLNSNLLIREQQGAAFDPVYSYPTPLNSGWPCSPDFQRSHPTVANRLYAGCGVGKLFRLEKVGSAWYHTAVPGYHDDQHAMEFFPDGSSAGGWSFLEGNDGGINRTSYFSLFGFDWELTNTINNGIDSAEFYRAGFDVSPTIPDVMIGGTQDNGVILYQPGSSPPGVWKANVGDFGDGTAAVIAPTDPKTMYAKPNTGMNKHMLRSQDGGGSWQQPKFQNLVDGDKGSYIFTDPGSASTIYFGGAQLQRSTDGGDSWEQLGPDDPQRKGDIVWVVASPSTPSGPLLYAGTGTHGQVWALYEMSYGLAWVLKDEHPDPAADVISMVLAPSNPNVLFVAYGHCTKNKRLARFEFWGTGGSHEWIAGNLPAIHATTNTELMIYTLAAYPSGDEPVFVGTDKGVYQGMPSEDGWFWAPYNNGLPLVRISKLISIPLTGEIRASTTGRGAWTIKPYWFPGPG